MFCEAQGARIYLLATSESYLKKLQGLLKEWKKKIFIESDHLPRPAGHASFDAAQDTVGFLVCEGTLLAHVQLAIYHYPQVFFQQGYAQFFHPLAGIGSEGCLNPRARSCIWIC